MAYCRPGHYLILLANSPDFNGTVPHTGLQRGRGRHLKGCLFVILGEFPVEGGVG